MLLDERKDQIESRPQSKVHNNLKVFFYSFTKFSIRFNFLWKDYKIEARNITAKWLDEELHDDLKDVCLTAGQRSLTAIIGEVGSGKVYLRSHKLGLIR